MGDDIPKDRVKELKQETIICRVKYHNNLPDIAFDPKFLTYPCESSRFVQYAATSLERNHKHELLCETDVGVDVDLIDPDVFKPDRSATLHPDDEKLLEDDDPNAINDRKSRHQRSVSWLRKTEYISTEHYNKFNKSDKIETKLGHNIKRRFTEELVYRDRESQIKAIQETFEAAKKPIKKHYSKPGVHAVEVVPLLPDFKLWRYPCAQVIFDDDPSRKGGSATEQKEELTQAVIRGMVDETGDHFVVYFLPSDETKRLRRLDTDNHVTYTDGASYEYEKAREYNWNVKNKTMANYEENYFFVFRKEDKECPAGVYYNELETRVRLSKRRKLQPGFPGAPPATQPPSNMRLVVQHRDFTYEELQAQTARLDMLKHESEGEEEEEEEEGVEEDIDEDLNSGDKEDGEGNQRRRRHGSSSAESGSAVSSPGTPHKGVSLPRLASAELAHSTEEEEHEVVVEETTRRRQGTRKRPATKLPLSKSAAIFSDDSEDEEEEEEEIDVGGIRGGVVERRSVSSALSNDEDESGSPPPPTRQKRQPVGSSGARRASIPKDFSSPESDGGDSGTPSPAPPQTRPNQSQDRRYESLTKRQFDTESDLSSLSD